MEQLKSKLKYKRTEITPSTDNGDGAIETPDFDYSISISQSETNPGKYVVTRKLENFKNSEIASKPEFNAIFSNHFDNLVFDLSKRISVTKLIDAIEALEDGSPITVHYNPSDTNTCTISIEGLNYDVIVTPHNLSITTNYQTSPERLITAFKETHKAILANPELKMLE